MIWVSQNCIYTLYVIYNIWQCWSWWNPCKKYRVHTGCMWFWLALDMISREAWSTKCETPKWYGLHDGYFTMCVCICMCVRQDILMWDNNVAKQCNTMRSMSDGDHNKDEIHKWWWPQQRWDPNVTVTTTKMRLKSDGNHNKDEIEKWRWPKQRWDPNVTVTITTLSKPAWCWSAGAIKLTNWLFVPWPCFLTVPN
jgi:hypothetical protein